MRLFTHLLALTLAPRNAGGGGSSPDPSPDPPAELEPAAEPAADQGPTDDLAIGVAGVAVQLARYYRGIGVVPAHPNGSDRGCHYPEDFLTEAAALVLQARQAIAGQEIYYRPVKPAATDR